MPSLVSSGLALDLDAFEVDWADSASIHSLLLQESTASLSASHSALPISCSSSPILSPLNTTPELADPPILSNRDQTPSPHPSWTTSSTPSPSTTIIHLHPSQQESTLPDKMLYFPQPLANDVSPSELPSFAIRPPPASKKLSQPSLMRLPPPLEEELPPIPSTQPLLLPPFAPLSIPSNPNPSQSRIRGSVSSSIRAFSVHSSTSSSPYDTQASTSSIHLPRTSSSSSPSSKSINSIRDPPSFSNPFASVQPDTVYSSSSSILDRSSSSRLRDLQALSTRGQRKSTVGRGLGNLASPLSLVVNQEVEADNAYKCPVCVERIGAEFRIAGERPDVIPECGHAVHHDCFIHVYGPLPEVNRFGDVQKVQSYGVCGVCRKPMRVSEDGGSNGGGSGKSNKLAALTGMKTLHGPPPPLLNPLHKLKQNPYNDDDSDENDPLEPVRSGAASTRSGQSDHVRYEAANTQMIVPSIAILPEFNSVVRSKTGKLVVTAVVVVEVPNRQRKEDFDPSRLKKSSLWKGPPSFHSQSHPEFGSQSPQSALPLVSPATPLSVSADYPFSDKLRSQLISLDGMRAPMDNLSTLLACNRAVVRTTSPSNPSSATDKEYILYLFKEALLLVQETPMEPSQPKYKASSIFRRKPSSSSASKPASSVGAVTYKLRGKVFVHHMKGVLDGIQGAGHSLANGNSSLTIVLEEKGLSNLTLTFPTRDVKKCWWDRITHLIPIILRDGSIVSEPITPLPNVTFGSSTGLNQPSHHLVTDHQPSGLNSPTFSTSSSRVSVPRGLSHTPIDILLIVSLTSLTIANSSTALRTRVIKASLAAIMGKLGPKDRLSVVTYENGPQGVIRKTPFLAVGREGSGRQRFFDLLDTIAEDGRGTVGDERFLTPLHREEKSDVVAAVNVALDVVLQRKTCNPFTGIALVCDSVDSVNRSQIDLVLARAEAANVPIHSIGYGKSHDPSPLWLISNHTHGTYTFVSDWYDLQDTLTGVIGGMMGIAITKMKLHISTAENDFCVRKVSGGDLALVPPDGKHVDIDLRELAHGDRREFLIELELDTPPPPVGEPGESTSAQSMAIEEVSVMEMDCSFFDPLCGKACSRLVHPILLLVTLLPPTESHHSPLPEPTISRRRIELMASDTIIRALHFVSKRNLKSARRLIEETRLIVRSVADGLVDQLEAGSRAGEYMSAKRERREALSVDSLFVMKAIMVDIDYILEGLEDESAPLFDRDQRNLGAQQAMILRSQKAWTSRTETEQLYFNAENALEPAQQSVSG